MSQTSPSVPPGLTRLGGTPPLRRYLADLWSRRQFAYANAMSELRTQHFDTALGNVWHLLNPVLLIAVYYLVFDVILNRGAAALEGGNYIGFLSVGILAYHWSTKAITGGARTITSNEGLIRSLQFPRALLPISTVLQETLTFLPGFVLMVMVVLVTGEGLSPSWLTIVPVFLLQFAFCLGAAFFTARAADKFRDTLNILPFLFRLVFYGSGILYAVDARFHGAMENPWVVRFFICNPFYALVSLWRDALMTTVRPSYVGWLWVSATIWAVVLLLAGLLVFRAGEKEYGRG